MEARARRLSPPEPWVEMGLRVTAAESSDLCHPRFGVPTFASRWSVRADLLPSYHDDPTEYAQVLLDLVRAHPRVC